jgi:hypothetical protein
MLKLKNVIRMGMGVAGISLVLLSGADSYAAFATSSEVIGLKIRISNRLHPTPRGAQMGWNRVMPEVMRSFFADFRAWPRPRLD